MINVIFSIEKTATGLNVKLQEERDEPPHPEEAKFAELLKHGYMAFLDRHGEELARGMELSKRLNGRPLKP